MVLEEVLLEIANELKESNRLKREQTKAFEGYSLNEDYQADNKETKAEEASKETEQPAHAESSKEDEPKSTELNSNDDVPDEATMKREVAKIIKGNNNDNKLKLKEKIKETGAKKVTDIQPEHRQAIIDYVKELENE